MNSTIYILGSVIIVSLLSVLAAIPFLAKKQISKGVLLILLSVSVGTLLGGAFLHLIPEVAEEGFSLMASLSILLGFMVFFVIEKFIHYHHNSCKDHQHPTGHSHGYHLAPINLIGDGIHNFIDGLVIAGAYLASIPVGIATTISVIFHEIPQEIADFGVLLYSGLSRTRAIMYNLLSALTAVLGAVLGIMLSKNTEFLSFIVPFAAGSFLYIAAASLTPELHRHCGIKDSIMHIVAIIIGIAIMFALIFLE